MVAINPQKIEGSWEGGVALDFHTTSSSFAGYNEGGHATFDTVRSEIGELLHRLKNKQDQGTVVPIASAAVSFLLPHTSKFDLIVPVPPSAARLVQPVILLARRIGDMLNKPVAQCVATTRPTTQLKGVFDPEKRRELVTGLYAVHRGATAGRSILLFDDLFRSGTTMNAIADLLRSQGGATSVRALTITRTRVNR